MSDTYPEGHLLCIAILGTTLIAVLKPILEHGLHDSHKIADTENASPKIYRRAINIYTMFKSYIGKLINIQYISRNMHTVFALLCFVVVIHWLIFPDPSGLLHWHCGNLTIAPVPAKQPWWIWINTSCEFIMNDCITTTKQSTTKPCAYFLGYTVEPNIRQHIYMPSLTA